MQALNEHSNRTSAEAAPRPTPTEPSAIELYWLPLGAGGHSVKHNGRVYEWVSARTAGRPPQDLFHGALEVRVDGARYVLEQAPAGHARGGERGVVAEGPVGARWAGKLRIFRYEIRLWRDGRIPDVAEAVGGPVPLSSDASIARRLLAVAGEVPPLTWGRDELGTGEMWNSNSVISWVLTRSGVDASAIAPPPGGRAPGWAAGIATANEDASRRGREPHPG